MPHIPSFCAPEMNFSVSKNEFKVNPEHFTYTVHYFTAAMIAALQECQDSGQDALCFAYEDSTFKEEWNDCIWGEMKPEEQILSDRIVKAWTNFATYG